MPGTQRRIDSGVAHRLLAEPYRFQFFQAVRVLEHLFVRSGVRAQDVLPRKLKFRNSLTLGFPASEIENLQAYTADDAPIEAHPKSDAPDLGKLAGVDITPAFMGMLGGQGVLPSGYTERIGEREVYHRDRAARAFLDIFTNRAVALFYSAWKKYRLVHQYELDGRERFLPLILSIAGLGLPSLRSRLQAGSGRVFDQAIAFYGGSIVQRPLSAAALQNMLCEYFGVGVRVEQFVGAWYDVPVGQRSRLGDRNASLGRTALSGARVWQRDLRVCLWIGPLRRARFEDFLPGGQAAAALAKWLTLLGGDALEYQVRLTLHRDDVRPGSLCSGNGMRLGWDSFVCTRESDADRTDATYLVHTLH
jgi:type VI secretion system protein ImpH